MGFIAMAEDTKTPIIDDKGIVLGEMAHEEDTYGADENNQHWEFEEEDRDVETTESGKLELEQYREKMRESCVRLLQSGVCKLVNMHPTADGRGKVKKETEDQEGYGWGLGFGDLVA